MKIVLIIITWLSGIPLSQIEIPMDSIDACERFRHRITVAWFDANSSDKFGHIMECQTRSEE